VDKIMLGILSDVRRY